MLFKCASRVCDDMNRDMCFLCCPCPLPLYIFVHLSQNDLTKDSYTIPLPLYIHTYNIYTPKLRSTNYIFCTKEKLANMSDQSLTWFSSHTKLKFFTKIRRFLQPRSSNKQSKPSDQEPIKENESMISVNVVEEGGCGVLQRSVKRLHFGNFEEKEVAAKDIIRLARQDLKCRKLMAELGVIMPLVVMVGSKVVARRSLAVRALVELANGTST